MVPVNTSPNKGKGEKKRKKTSRKGVKSSRYTQAALEAAVLDVKNGVSKKAAARKHGIPRATLQFRLSDRFQKTERGPAPILTHDEESLLVKWLLECSKKGFPRRKGDIKVSVHEFIRLSDRPNPFKDNMPGDGWYKAFLKRHPQIRLRTCEAITAASSCLSESDVRKWFSSIEICLTEEGSFQILQDPTRVFNGDETNFLLCPNNGKVLAEKAVKNVYEIDRGLAKASITVMFTFSASGCIVPPMIIYPNQRIRAEIQNSIPDPEWGIGRSDNGWMKAELFYEYIANIFSPYLTKHNIQRPVILFVDGHKSHLTCQLSELCTELQIVLVSLYPNATRILQPADVAAFKPLKDGWKQGVQQWRRDHPTDVITKENFAPLLKSVIDKHVKKETLISGFKACGIYPWDPNAVDYTKCLGKDTSSSGQLSQEHEEISQPASLEWSKFKDIVGPEMLQVFNDMDEGAIAKESEPMRKLFEIYKTFCTGTTRNSEVTDREEMTEENVLIDAVCPVVDDVPDGTGEIILITTPAKPTPSIAHDNISPLADVLHWPESPKRKGVKSTERMPFVITCRDWKLLSQNKKDKKQAEENEKQNRKRIRLEKKTLKEKEKIEKKAVKGAEKRRSVSMNRQEIN
ncbi:uncharacterized protein [Anabrus simplex]|uniref:uncharacterized protein n=1 Tax=Anabrus simplex TaxID=316456 RepID=UPI0035A3AEBB